MLTPIKAIRVGVDKKAFAKHKWEVWKMLRTEEAAWSVANSRSVLSSNLDCFFAVPKFLAQKSFSTLQGYNTFWAFQLYFSFVLISNVFLNTSNRIFNDVPPASSVWAYLFYVHMDILIVPRSEWTHAIWTLFFNSNYPGIELSIQTKFKKWANKSQTAKLFYCPQINNKNGSKLLPKLAHSLFYITFLRT